MISQETINKVFSLDIVEVISRHVELKRTGANYKGFSPFTNERTPSFVVSPQKQIYKCFSSGKGGNLVKFVMEKDSLTYQDLQGQHIIGKGRAYSCFRYHFDKHILI